MEFLVEFEIEVPAGTAEAEVSDRERAVTVTGLERHPNDPA